MTLGKSFGQMIARAKEERQKGTAEYKQIGTTGALGRGNRG